ncbi:MAG: GntR family transcriptional regulator [Planctomycetaceae bacterium]|jgi:GntR family transcriptional regulator|nr:GntR family transcriptional regulator [Planctomycetaceae bacterium]
MLNLKLDYHSSEPLYLQAVLQVKRLVVTKKLLPGEKLPSIRLLAKALQINPTTTSRIFAQLAAEGIVVQRPGLGMFVSDAPSPFSDEFIRSELNRQALAYLIEGLRYGLEYKQLTGIIDEQHKILLES